MPTWAMWAVCLALLAFRAMLAGAESALYGTSELRARELAQASPRRGGRVLRHKLEREATASSIRFGSILGGFLAAAISTLVPIRVLDFSRYAEGRWVDMLTALLSASFVGLLAAMFDVSWRSAVSTQPEKWAVRLGGLVSFAVAVFNPVMRLLVTTLNLLLRPFSTRVRFEAPPPPLEELEKLIAAQAARAQIDKGAPQIIRSIFEMSETRVRDLMVPRTDIVAVDITTDPNEILRILAEENHSRMPVFRDDIDHIVGVLHVRDLVPMMQHPELIVLPDIIRPAHFVPWLKPIGDLLREMQRQKIHMAMVVDEYGGFMGIVTLEDILREIVGDIGDEFEVEVNKIEMQPDGSYLVDAAMETWEFPQAFGFSLPEGEYETLAGFLSSLAGSIPEVGDRFQVDGWHFFVHAKDGPRIDRVRMVKAKPPEKPRVVTNDSATEDSNSTPGEEPGEAAARAS